MDVDYHLSAGACAQITQARLEDEVAWNMQPTVQFLSIKKLLNSKPGDTSAPDRYRLIISDGVHFVQAMLATQLNELVENNKVTKHSVVKLEKYTSNIVQNKRYACLQGLCGLKLIIFSLIIVLGMRVLGEASEKLGDPKGLDTTPSDRTTTHGDGPGVGSPSNATVARPPVQQQPLRAMYPTGGEKSAPTIFAIEGLSPYQNKWTIKARVIQKSDIKHWSNAKGEGKLFSLTLMDETGEIKATAFNQVVDELYDRIEEGKVYYVSRARVNIAKKKFSHLQNQYELSLERSTEIEEVCYFNHHYNKMHSWIRVAVS